MTIYRGLGFALSYPADWRRIDAGPGWLTLVPRTSNTGPGGTAQAIVAVHELTEARSIEDEVQRWAKTDPVVSRRTLHGRAPARGCGDIEEFVVSQQVIGLVMRATNYACAISGKMYGLHLEAPAADKNQSAYRATALAMMRSLRVVD
ncbi:MAG TPA: hypothetical protein VL358_04195 [Caulobacteraceae bacterium]|nr:hypothetical protein [Caulobacteraceae bacterium]